MLRMVRIAGVQAEPRIIGAPLDDFERDVHNILAANEGVDILVYPELHLFGSDDTDIGVRNARLRSSSVPLDDPFVRRLGDIARSTGVWFIPGSICERGPEGQLFNTALVFSPEGDMVAHYRKVFPWRPSEPYDMGDRFVVFDIPDRGRFGLSICYDSWFPEVSRHLAWMGAEVVLNIVKTTTSDRMQELVLARANSIVNQTFTVSINCAAPVGMGQSIIVDPEGAVLLEADDQPAILVQSIDLDEVTRVREVGTAGVNRMWSQFTTQDPVLELPLYDGRITPERWYPQSATPNTEDRS